ncbi:alpha/beta fold hydrolase [Erythrobacter pelagi]|uniref:Palmitoyl-protein thioesterase ABHD10, mitochondrial n=2 Tax=Qipengyuania pelagi TaxID=994320 RepID=A0A844YCB6_9SPHN|nr:alpha/beta hydrolase [Qipengyuania pelagi]MXO54883.1 alpha/beta fold hydrolase [Qipengyuania pelagi]
MSVLTEYFDGPQGRRIAYRHIPGNGPALVFLPGYMSDMAGSKATALIDWARETGRECLLLDYSGCGQSDGAFADGTLSRWRDEVVALVEDRIAGDVILIGSSMGGWLMLLMAEALGDRIAGLVGIAAAPDFTEWGLDADQKAQLERGETVFEDNPYGPDPTPTHPGFYRDAQALCRLDGAIALDSPARLIHGQRDADVPWEIALRLADRLRSDDIQVTLVKDGDHRLSRPQDIALLLRVIGDLAAPSPS